LMLDKPASLLGVSKPLWHYVLYCLMKVGL
jgi:hypothetical protein